MVRIRLHNDHIDALKWLEHKYINFGVQAVLQVYKVILTGLNCIVTIGNNVLFINKMKNITLQ